MLGCQLRGAANVLYGIALRSPLTYTRAKIGKGPWDLVSGRALICSKVEMGKGPGDRVTKKAKLSLRPGLLCIELLWA